MKVTSITGPDKIGNLINAGSNISLAPSIITLGGLQYRTESTLNVALPSMTENTRYQIYAVLNAGNLELVISQNENSQGPAGYGGWKLVGSFYSNNLSPVSFGGFLNISGRPVSDWWDTSTDIPKAFKATNVDPSFGTLDTNIYRLRRDGDHIQGEWYIRQTAQGSAGSGTYQVMHPFPLDRPHYIQGPGSTTWRSALGTVGILELAPGSWRGVSELMIPFDTFGTNNFICPMGLTQNGGSTLANNWGNIVPLGGGGQILTITIKYKYKVSGWTETPIEDL